jgi:hypothetical protein
LEVNHQISLANTARERLEFLMRLALCVVVLKVLLAANVDMTATGVSLCALVGKRLAGFHRHEVWGADLWRGRCRKARRYSRNARERRKGGKGRGISRL